MFFAERIRSMVLVTSLAVQLAFILIYIGLLQQIRLGLRHQLPHGLRAGYMAAHLGRYLSWVAYGAILASPDWLLIETRGIAAVLVIVVIIQRLRHDLSVTWTLFLGVLSLGVISGMVFWLVQLPRYPWLAPTVRTVVGCFFAMQLFYSIPLQIRRMTAHEAALISTWYMSTLLFNNLANLAYGFARPDWMVVVVYALATIQQGRLVLRIRKLRKQEHSS
jgi:hypothetical protein